MTYVNTCSRHEPWDGYSGLMSTSYVEQHNTVQHTQLRRHLAATNVFAEADELFDAIDAGENPLTDTADPRELAERFKLTRG